MLRLVAVAVSCLLIAACSTPPAPKLPDDLGDLSARVAGRMKEMGTATYRTEVTWSGESGANVDTTVAGAWRQDDTGISATMHVRRGVGGTFRELLTVVLVPGAFYSTPAGGDRWSRWSDQEDPEQYYSVLGGFGLTTAVGTELDYLEPRAATITGTAVEDVDGVAAIRYDLVADPARMAPLFRDPYRVRRHDELAAERKSVEVSVWLDEYGLPLKATCRLPFTQARASTTWFTDWGKPVDITEPPADRVIAR